MSFLCPVKISSYDELKRVTTQVAITATVSAALTVAVLGSRPTAADEPEAVSETANAEPSEMSAREKRREERRRDREESSVADEAATSEESDEANAANETAPVFVVAVEPEMECRRIAVVGSRIPKEVCTPVNQRAADEQEAQDFLRRTRERSTIAVSCPPTVPGLPGPAATVC